MPKAKGLDKVIVNDEAESDLSKEMVEAAAAAAGLLVTPITSDLIEALLSAWKVAPSKSALEGSSWMALVAIMKRLESENVNIRSRIEEE